MLKLSVLTAFLIASAGAFAQPVEGLPALPPLPGMGNADSAAEPSPDADEMPPIPEFSSSDAPETEELALPEMAEDATAPAELPSMEMDAPFSPFAPNITSQPPVAQMPSLPELENPDDIDFFQPGAQNTLPPLPDNLTAQAPDTDTDTAAPPPAPPVYSMPKTRPVSRNFNYKIQRLPPPIYKKSYDGENKHLPVATYEQDLDRHLLVAVAQNNMNAVRALLDHAGRPITLRDAQGRTLVQIAQAYGASTVWRLLKARGAPDA